MLHQDLFEQQGGDITASDMISPDEDSEIQNFYKNSTIFVTGATGFIGKLCIEKLLRTCPELKRIYILMRAKKGLDARSRFEEIFNEPTFDPLRRKDPNFTEKVHAIVGDVGLSDLGLNELDREKLIQEVDCILHFAATVRFDAPLRTATHINVRGVRDLIKIATKMKKLRAFLHVSTAFSNCIRKDIDEKFYDPPIAGEKLLTLVECLNDDHLEKITKTILGDFPNTYAFTKCVAEDIIRNEARNLPIAVYRPSIVIATVKEPVSGWINNIYGATGVLLGVAMGLLRTLYGKKENKADMVPADFVVNSCLAACWDVATIKTLNDNKETQDKQSREEKFEKQIPIYNYVSTVQNPITWDEFEKLSQKYCKQIPSEKVVWHHMFKMRSNYFAHVLALFFLHTVPAYLVDFVRICLGKKPLLVKSYQKINNFGKVLSYFTMNEWKFNNDNVQSLWSRMKNNDKRLFEFDIENLDWDTYFQTYTKGARVYLLKDPLDTIPQGNIKYYKVMIAHYLIMTFLLYLCFKFCMMFYYFIF